jgi:hypothetical protein
MIFPPQGLNKSLQHHRAKHQSRQSWLEEQLESVEFEIALIGEDRAKKH